MIHIPIEVIADILQYLNPDRLHKLAIYSQHTRYITTYEVKRRQYIDI